MLHAHLASGNFDFLLSFRPRLEETGSFLVNYIF